MDDLGGGKRDLFHFSVLVWFMMLLFGVLLLFLVPTC
jgi:hypothetical protein